MRLHSSSTHSSPYWAAYWLQVWLWFHVKQEKLWHFLSADFYSLVLHITWITIFKLKSCFASFNRWCILISTYIIFGPLKLTYIRLQIHQLSVFHWHLNINNCLFHVILQGSSVLGTLEFYMFCSLFWCSSMYNPPLVYCIYNFRLLCIYPPLSVDLYCKFHTFFYPL